MVAAPSDPIEFPEYRPWRRTIIFLIAFAICATAGLSWVFTRPAEYRATLQMDIQPARVIAGQGGDPVLTEAQVLTSAPVVQDAIQRLSRAGAIPNPGRDTAAVTGHLQARVVGRPGVVEVSAEGPGQLVLERLLNMVAETYRDRATRLYEQQIVREEEDLRLAVSNFHASAAEARAKLDEFRAANPAIPEQADKAVTIDLQNLRRIFTASTNDLAKSREYLQTLSRKIDAARAPGAERSDPPGQAAAIVAAVQQLQTTQTRVNRLRGALAIKEKEAGDTAALISEYNMLQDDVDQAEQSEQRAAERLNNLSATRHERAPVIRILQPALSGSSPVRPDYARNTWIALAASGLLGFVAVRCASLFAGPPAVAFYDPPVHMQCWDAAPALTYRPTAPLLLPPPDPSTPA